MLTSPRDRAERFGARLRESRRGRELTRADVARSTRIPIRTIALLEDGEFASLPAEVFVRGFLRSYAVAVGMDPDTTLGAYDACREPAPAPEPDSSAPARGGAALGPEQPSRAERVLASPRSRRAASLLALLVLAAAVARCVATAT